MCTDISCSIDTSGRPLPVLKDVDRRRFLLGAASLPLATVLAYPELAQAASHKMQDFAITTPSGQLVGGSLAVPKAGMKAPAIVLIHEWWGLNDQIRAVAHDLSEKGYLVLAIDLYDGQYGSPPDEARALMQAVDAEKTTEKLVTAVNWLRANGNGKVATMGWCFGGSWSLNTSIATPVDGTVIYYGWVNRSAEDVAALSGRVLGHFATQDKLIDKAMVDGFEATLKEVGRDGDAIHWYDADHAFANPTGSRYDAEDAALAWDRTTAFLKDTLR